MELRNPGYVHLAELYSSLDTNEEELTPRKKQRMILKLAEKLSQFEKFTEKDMKFVCNMIYSWTTITRKPIKNRVMDKMKGVTWHALLCICEENDLFLELQLVLVNHYQEIHDKVMSKKIMVSLFLPAFNEFALLLDN